MTTRYDADAMIRPFADDIIFLTQLGEISGERTYRQRAVLYHARTRSQFATGSALAEHYIGKKASLSGWDLSSQIEAAVAVGQREYAQAIATHLIVHRADWEGVPFSDGVDYTLLSRAALISGLDHLEGPIMEAYRGESHLMVLNAQGMDGSWQNDFQVTAYALMSLEHSPQCERTKRAIAGGAKFLLSTQTAAGGWAIPPEYGEINGEVLSALAPLTGAHRGVDMDRGREFGDPQQKAPRGRAHRHDGFTNK